jgi:hypothetical protein
VSGVILGRLNGSRITDVSLTSNRLACVNCSGLYSQEDYGNSCGFGEKDGVVLLIK